MSPTQTIYPNPDWLYTEPRDVNIDPDKLAIAEHWLRDNAAADKPYRTVVVRNGHIAAEFHSDLDFDEPQRQASAGKSTFSCMLAIAIAEGRINSADDPVVDYFPEMMDIPDGSGPKPGRFAREKDRNITFRQLIGNTSGYLKPDELPGDVFHYQTFGMNILCHAIARAYDRYNTSDPDSTQGIGSLIEEKIRNPIGGTWTWKYTNFQHPPDALVNIFGNYTNLCFSVRDMARLGWLWRNNGKWNDKQIIPANWLHDAIQVPTQPRKAVGDRERSYGLGFWSNCNSAQWPSLPSDSYTASGAGNMLITVCPSLDLVIAQGPGIFNTHYDEDTALTRLIINACK